MINLCLHWKRDWRCGVRMEEMVKGGGYYPGGLFLIAFELFEGQDCSCRDVKCHRI